MTPTQSNDEQLKPTRSAASRSRLTAVLLGTLAAVMMLVVGLGVGYGLGRITSPSALASTDINPFSAAPGDDEPSVDSLEENFGIFWEAMTLLYRDFYGELPENDEAVYDAIIGVVSQLDDPNTSFLDPKQADVLRTGLEGEFEGIGSRVDWDFDFNVVRIVEPFENQPAWNAGLRRGDLVLAIDGESVEDLDLNEAVNRIRGPKGSEVVLTVLTEGDLESREVVIVRDRIEIPTISTDTLGEDGEIAYINLNTFNENASRLVREAVEEALEADPEAMILDLRGNPGGLLNEAVNLASIFQEEKEVVIERFSDGTVQRFERDGKAIATEIPLVVLVNGGSASASEIVAGSLQDHERATLIGETTYGKGSVQLPHTLSDGSIMRVTIARWFTPDDRSIDGNGLAPDIPVALTLEDFEAERDPQLEAAIDYLEGDFERENYALPEDLIEESLLDELETDEVDGSDAVTETEAIEIEEIEVEATPTGD